MTQAAALARIEEMGRTQVTAEEMTEARAGDDADRERKTATRAMWALGDYHRFATELVWEIGPELVSACGIAAGQRALDGPRARGTSPSAPPRPARRWSLRTSRPSTSRQAAVRPAGGG